MSEKSQPKAVKGDSTPGSPTTNAIDIEVPKVVDDIRGPGSLGAREALGLDDDPSNLIDSLRQKPSAEVSYNATIPPRKRAAKPKAKVDATIETPPEGKPGEPAGEPAVPGQTEPPDPGTTGEPTGDPGTTPSTPGEPDETPTPSAIEPATPPAPTTVKIGDKEFTTEQLEALVKKSEAAPAPPTPPQEPKPVADPEPPAPTEPTEEEKAAQVEKDRRFVEDTASKITFTKISEPDMDVILEGGEPAAAKMGELLAQQAANTILETRRGVYDDVNKYIADLESRLGPVFTQQDQLQKAAVETQFLQTYPEFGKNEHALKAARQVAEQLVTQFPEDTAKMDLPTFVAEVERQTSAYLTSQVKMWNPAFDGSWRDFQPPAAPQAAPVVPAAPQAAPAAPGALLAPPVPLTSPAAPAAPTARPRPPAANAPVATPAIGDPKARDWQTNTAKSLAD